MFLFVLAGIECLLWIIGMVTHNTFGGYLHLTLVLACIAVATEFLLRLRHDLDERRARREALDEDWPSAA